LFYGLGGGSRCGAINALVRQRFAVELARKKKRIEIARVGKRDAEP
jgi:hypothetical protein